MSNDMLKSYLFVIDSSTMSRDDAVKEIDKIKSIENWQKILPDAVVLVSKNELKELQNILREIFVDQRYIVILLESGNKNGWLAKSSWEFINIPKSVFDE